MAGATLGRGDAIENLEAAAIREALVKCSLGADWPSSRAAWPAATLAGWIPPERLRRGFGIFVLVMAALMLADQLGVF